MTLRVFLISLFLATNAFCAEFNLDALLKEAKNAPKNAPDLFASAAKDNPKLLLPIVSAAVAAMPEQAIEIVRAMLKLAPKSASDIVKAAVIAQPKLAADFVAVAVVLFPERADEIRLSADNASKEVEKAFPAPTESNLGKANANGNGPSAPAFPAQPIRPDLVSPSS